MWTLKLKRFDFRPQDGSYHMNWPGPPRHNLTFADTERYDLDIELVNPAPIAFRTYVFVQNDISWWRDDIVGTVTLEFDRNATRPRLIRYQNSTGLPVPSGAPADGYVTDWFWLGCSRSGEVRGNGGRSGRQINGYIEMDLIHWLEPGAPKDLTHEGSLQSRRHKIRCN
jgi:hypothetical protein